MSVVILLNIKTSTKQGINYKWSEIKIPLYLKLLNFFDRHYNYNELVKRIIKDVKADEERVMEIFEWTYANIRNVPEGYPVIDDHVWHIIVRGYGTDDQASDVFTTLCNYAGLNAFFSWVYAKDQTQRIPLSFVKIKNNWFAFDPYHGIYFKDKEGKFANIDMLRLNAEWIIGALGEKPKLDYYSYFSNIPTIKSTGLTRANTQSPLRRIIYKIKKWLKLS